MRESGVLLPIASLPSPYGIGCFSKEAYRFVDQLKAGGQKYWQILPLGPTGYGDSPYQSFSTFAGNPYYIDLQQLIDEGLINEAMTKPWHFEENEGYIDYEKVYRSRKPLLEAAFAKTGAKEDEKFEQFCKEEAYWLEDYTLYMALKDHFGGSSWQLWDEPIRLREPEAMIAYTKRLEKEKQFYAYTQYLFMSQWQALKDYAHTQGIQIIGDIPIYVALDSVDTWAQSDLFLLDEKKAPISVAGCPPDAFAATGQLWGNPLYVWEKHEAQDYKWWISRVRHCFKLYDVVRIDHFRGFDAYYAIPAADETAEFGKWQTGPGYQLFEAIKRQLGDVRIIAEDLGYLTESVKKLLAQTGYPGMKVIQFAFDAREDSDYLPHNYDHNCVVYTGTHDNDTLKGWYEKLPEADRHMAEDYAYIPQDQLCCQRLIALAYQSVADLVVVPLQDFLELGSEARINTPSTLGGNWKWRLKEGMLGDTYVAALAKMVATYKRT
ncbi:MAG: 4-alpha-glucanotransferase [Cellulosilyticaceae bacterium]